MLLMKFQRLRLEATSNAAWFVNGQPVNPEWPLRPGKHTILAVDKRGARDEVRIYVK